MRDFKEFYVLMNATFIIVQKTSKILDLLIITIMSCKSWSDVLFWSAYVIEPLAKKLRKSRGPNILLI